MYATSSHPVLLKSAISYYVLASVSLLRFGGVAQNEGCATQKACGKIVDEGGPVAGYGPVETSAVSDTSPRSPERRSGPRKRTSRAALFAANRSGSLLHGGTVVNISRDGLQVHTRRPEAPGTQIHVEVSPKADDAKSTLILLTGRVVRIAEWRGGGYAMGVRTFLCRGTPPAAVGERPGPLMNVPALAEMAVKHVGRSPGMPSVSRASTQGPQMDTGRKDRRWDTTIVLCLGLLALLAMLLQGVQSVPAYSLAAAYSGAGAKRVEESRPAPPSDDWYRSSFSRGGGRLREKGRPVEGSPQREAPPKLAAHRGLHVARAGRVIPPQGTGYLDQGSEPQLWIGVLDAGLADGPSPPGPGAYGTFQLLSQADVLRDGEGELRNWGQSSLAGLIPDDPWFLPAHVGAETAMAAASAAMPWHDADSLLAPVIIVIDEGAFVLTIIKDGRAVRCFPVGLGRDHATPSGFFRIAQKITDPDWFNGKETIKAGDSRNPLGKRWMGLVAGDAATSYGIHPTRDPQDIGRPSSRGCIRMRPEDAETVFRLCPSGTPVLIHSGVVHTG